MPDSYWYDAGLVIAVVSLGTNWFGDSLDGTVARVRGQQRPMYGFYVDHVVDIVGALFLLVGLGMSPYMSPIVALLLLVAYLMLSAEVYLATHACGIFRVSLFKIGPTELRIMLGLATLYLLNQSQVELGSDTYLLFDVGGVVAVVGMFAALLFSTGRNTLALYRAEPLPGGVETRQ